MWLYHLMFVGIGALIGSFLVLLFRELGFLIRDIQLLKEIHEIVWETPDKILSRLIEEERPTIETADGEKLSVEEFRAIENKED